MKNTVILHDFKPRLQTKSGYWVAKAAGMTNIFWHNRFEGFLEAGVEEAVDQGIKGWIKVTKPHQGVENNGGGREVYKRISYSGDEERQPAQQEDPHNDGQGFSRLPLPLLGWVTLCLARGHCSHHVSDDSGLFAGHVEDFEVQGAHDGPGDEEVCKRSEDSPLFVKNERAAPKAWV